LKDWRKKLKKAYHRAAKRSRGAGKNTTTGLNAVLNYLSFASELSEKLNQSITTISDLIEMGNYNISKFNELLYFKSQLDKHIDLVRRRFNLSRNHPPSGKSIFFI